MPPAWADWVPSSPSGTPNLPPRRPPVPAPLGVPDLAAVVSSPGLGAAPGLAWANISSVADDSPGGRAGAGGSDSLAWAVAGADEPSSGASAAGVSAAVGSPSR